MANYGPKFRTFSNSLVDTARLHSKANTQAHEQIEGLRASITKIERRMKISVRNGDMLKTMKLALLLTEQTKKLQREVDRFNSETVKSPDRNMRQFEETNGQRRIRVKAVSKRVL